MKKARKKRIVRRKRRISEREIMRIKRKLKKSAKKLRLGAKRTGAYVYGTLRRIVGNPGEGEVESEGRRLLLERLRIARMQRLQKPSKSIEFIVQGYYPGSGWEDLTSADNRWEALQDLKAYRENETQYAHRLIRRRVKKILPNRRRLRGNPNDYSIRDIKSGDRIQLHPGHDMWMRGARFGTVVGVGQKLIAVKLDGVRKYVKILPRHVGEIYPNRRRGLRKNPGKLFPASYPPEKKLILFLARREGWKKYKVSRAGTYPFELRIDGVGKNDIQFSGLLKLIAIHSLVNWTSPQVAMMSSYPSMAREGDWSGIRDSSDEAIDNIFYNFVLKPLGIARPVSR